MKRSSGRFGFSVPELLVSIAVFAVLLAGFTFIMSFAFGSWSRASALSSAQTQLKKAEYALRSDLLKASAGRLQVTNGPSSLGSMVDGDAVWFLSAVDPTTGEFVRNDDGTPNWQRNILYYTAIPTNHFSLHGYLCAGVASPEGYEVACPHKVLMKRVIDYDTPTSPNIDPSVNESLIPSSEISTYIARPDNLGNTPTAAGVEQSRLVASQLVTFRVSPEANSYILITLLGAKTESARKALQIGSESLQNSPYAVEFLFAIPANNASGG